MKVEGTGSGAPARPFVDKLAAGTVEFAGGRGPPGLADGEKESQRKADARVLWEPRVVRCALRV